MRWLLLTVAGALVPCLLASCTQRPLSPSIPPRAEVGSIESRLPLKCREAFDEFEKVARDSRACVHDEDCAPVTVRPAPGCCCYAAARGWAESDRKVELVSAMLRECPRLDYGCGRTCAVGCVAGECRPLFMTNANPYCGRGFGELENETWSPERWLEFVSDGGR